MHGGCVSYSDQKSRKVEREFAKNHDVWYNICVSHLILIFSSVAERFRKSEHELLLNFQTTCFQV